MATSIITDYACSDEGIRVNAGSVAVDVSKYKDGPGEGSFFFLAVARSWYISNASSSLYMISGIQNGLYQSCAQIIKETYGPTMSLSGDTLTITFTNVNGGFYSIIPLYNKPI